MMYGGVRVQLPIFLTSVWLGVQLLASGKEFTEITEQEARLGPRADLEAVEKRKSPLYPCLELKPNFLSHGMALF